MPELKPLQRYAQDDYAAVTKCANGSFVSYADVKEREKMLADALRSTTHLIISYDDLERARALLSQFDAEDHQ